MRHTPVPDAAPVRRIVTVLIASGIAVFMLSPVLKSARAAFQAAALLFLSAGIYITVRYLMTSFSYAVLPRGDAVDDGTVSAAVGAFHVRHLPPSSLDFVVTKSQGQRIGITEARLSMDELLYFGALSPKGAKKEILKRHPSARLYNYTVSLRPNSYIAVFEDSRGNQIGIVFEPDTAMAEYFADTAEKNQVQ